MRTRLGMSAAIALAIAVSLLGSGVSPAAGSATVSATHDTDWTTAIGGAANIAMAADVATDKFGNIYVSGGNDDVVQMYNKDLDYVKAITASGSGDGQLNNPRSVSCDRWGNIYVADAGNMRIAVFMPELYGFNFNIFGYGATPGPTRLTTVNRVSAALDGTVYATDNLDWICRWSRDGDLLGSVATTGPVIGVAASQEGRRGLQLQRRSERVQTA